MKRRRSVWIVIAVVVVLIAVFLRRTVPHPPKVHPAPTTASGPPAILDRELTEPLNDPGGGPAPEDAYAVYSDLYEAPVQEPLVFAEDSRTDIPQLNGSCLQARTKEEHEMEDAFSAANRLSHRWTAKFAIPQGFRLLSNSEAERAKRCMETHFEDAAGCAAFKGVGHIRYLGVPGFNRAHTRAVVSVIKKCGSFCGSGGVFVAEKVNGKWRRAENTDFDRECSWMY